MADPIERDIIEQLTGLLGSSIDQLLHTAFGSALTLLLTLVGFKYQGSATTLFREHSLVISLFIVDVLVYVVAFVNEAARTTNSSTSTTNSCRGSNTRPAYKHIFLISGAIGCELLLFILVTHVLMWFVLNMFVFLFFEVQRRWHQQINELLTTVTSSILVPAKNYLIHNMFWPPYRNGFWVLARLYYWGQQVFTVYPLFTRGIRVEQDQDVDVGDGIFCNNLFNSALSEESWFLRIYNGVVSFSSIGRSVEHQASGDVQMTHMA